MANDTPMRLAIRDEAGYERVVMAEVLVPDVPNSWGDIYPRDAIKEFVYEFARQGFGIDVEHNQEDVQYKDAMVVESFIVRAGDPDFIEGSWVVGMKILNDDLWEQVKDGSINGFSFQAKVTMQEVVFQNLRNRQITGVTSPDLTDGHTHTYLILVDVMNRPISGGTGTTDGHSHTISTHTVTNTTNGHRHRFQVLAQQQDDEDDDENEDD